MRKILIVSGLALVMCCLLFAACSKDDDTDVNTASVTGYWICYYQCWSEDGETWESSYILVITQQKMVSTKEI